MIRFTLNSQAVETEDAPDTAALHSLTLGLLLNELI